ncbi:hypothetical protein AHAS_Ahas11G0229100 [Arachis hypogaea]
MVAKENLIWLHRSLVGGTTKAIDYRSLKESVAKNFPQVIQREIGAYKALLTFDSLINAKEAYTFKMDSLLKLFHSSFCVGRVQIDTCVLDVINEWIHITIGTSGFDVLVKEVGRKTFGTNFQVVTVEDEAVRYKQQKNICAMVCDDAVMRSKSPLNSINCTDQAAEVIMEGLREEVEDNDKLVISETILNEWSYEYLSPNQMNLVTSHTHNSGIDGFADLVGYEGSTKSDSELTVSWDYCCKSNGLVKEVIRSATQKSVQGPNEGDIRCKQLVGHEGPRCNTVHYVGDAVTSPGPGWRRTGKPRRIQQGRDAPDLAAATRDVRRNVGGVGPSLRTRPRAEGSERSAGREMPKPRRETRIEGGGEGLSNLVAFFVEDEPCKFVGESALDNDDGTRKVGSGGDLVMEEGHRKVTDRGTGEQAPGVKGPEIEAACDRISPEHQERDGFSDDEDTVEDRTLANDNEASDNESSRLNEQLLENKRAWKLAKESGTELYVKKMILWQLFNSRMKKLLRKKIGKTEGKS